MWTELEILLKIAMDLDNNEIILYNNNIILQLMTKNSFDQES